MNFDADLLKELRDHTRNFIKLDLAYLAAGGAIITALKIGRAELLEFGAKAYIVAFALALVITIDVIIESMVFKDWMAVRLGLTKRSSAKAMRMLLDIQPQIHLFFVVGLIVGSTSFALGSESVRRQIEARVELQEVVDLFVQKNGRAPTDVKELRQASALARQTLNKLGDEKVLVESRNAKGYKLTFAGYDKQLDTDDDEVVTEDFSLRRVYERMQERDKPQSDH